MSGRKFRSGPKPMPVAWHVAAGTYRPDRHGPLPATPAAPAAPDAVDVDRLTAGLGDAGRALVLEHVEGLSDWTPRDFALLRQAGEARDRQVALAEAIGTNVVVDGEPHPALRAERLAGAAVVAALRALDIRPDPSPAGAQRRTA